MRDDRPPVPDDPGTDVLRPVLGWLIILLAINGAMSLVGFGVSFTRNHCLPDKEAMSERDGALHEAL